jgi:hypothetical protein
MNGNPKITTANRIGKGEFDSVDFQFTPKPLSVPYTTMND